MTHLSIKRTQYFSSIRAAACLAIIVLHICNASEILYREQISLTERIAALSVTESLMWAVPCFIMVSGALLLDPAREITLKKIFTRYIRRVLAALLICCIVFRGFDMVMNVEGFSLLFIPQGIRNMLTEGSWAHLWYLYLLIGLYLLLPFYRKAAEHSSDSELKYLLTVYFIFISALQLTQLGGVQIAFYIHVSTIYPFYLFAGYAIAHDRVRIRSGAAAAMTAAGIAGMVICTWIRRARDFEAMDCLLGYSSVLTVLMACGIFALCREAARRKEQESSGRLTRILNSIDENSFGIYLLHMIPVRLVLRYWSFNPFANGGIAAFAGVTLAIFAVTYVIVWLLRKIPAVRLVL